MAVCSKSSAEEGAAPTFVWKASKSWTRSQGSGEGHYDYTQSIGHFTARPHRRQLDTRLSIVSFSPFNKSSFTTQPNISAKYIAIFSALFILLISIFLAQLLHNGSHQGGKSILAVLLLLLFLGFGERGSAGCCCRGGRQSHAVLE